MIKQNYADSACLVLAARLALATAYLVRDDARSSAAGGMAVALLSRPLPLNAATAR